MDQTFQALGSILLKAIPTAVLLLVLYFYLKVMLFAPLAKVLKDRDALTKGTREVAKQSLAKAEQKAHQFEISLREARGEVYKENEEIRRKMLEEQIVQLDQAKAATEVTVKSARAGIAQEAATARQGLTESSAALAEQIASAVLAKRHS